MKKWKEELGILAHFSEPAITDDEGTPSPTEPQTEGGSGGEGPDVRVAPEPDPTPEPRGNVIELTPRVQAMLEKQGVRSGQDLDDLLAVGEDQAQRAAEAKARKEAEEARQRQLEQGTEAEQRFNEQYIDGLEAAMAKAGDDPRAQAIAAETYRVKTIAQMVEAQRIQAEQERRQSEAASRKSREEFFQKNPDLLKYRGLIEDTVASGAPPGEVVQFIRQVRAVDEQHPTDEDIPLAYTLPRMTKKDLWNDLAKSGQTQGNASSSAPPPEDDKAYVSAAKALRRSMFGPSKGELWGKA